MLTISTPKVEDVHSKSVSAIGGDHAPHLLTLPAPSSVLNSYLVFAKSVMGEANIQSSPTNAASSISAPPYALSCPFIPLTAECFLKEIREISEAPTVISGPISELPTP